jgi:carbamoylphosphate synthase large subunit
MRERVKTFFEAVDVLSRVGLPARVVPAFVLSELRGDCIARTNEQFDLAVVNGLTRSPIHEVLIESV